MMYTQDTVPFEDNYINEAMQRKAVLAATHKDKDDRKSYKSLCRTDPEKVKEKMFWSVIDPVKGVSYDAEFDLATEVINKHYEKYYDYSEKLPGYCTAMSIHAQYYYSGQTTPTSIGRGSLTIQRF